MEDEVSSPSVPVPLSAPSPLDDVSTALPATHRRSASLPSNWLLGRGPSHHTDTANNAERRGSTRGERLLVSSDARRTYPPLPHDYGDVGDKSRNKDNNRYYDEENLYQNTDPITTGDTFRTLREAPPPPSTLQPQPGPPLAMAVKQTAPAAVEGGMVGGGARVLVRPTPPSISLNDITGWTTATSAGSGTTTPLRVPTGPAGATAPLTNNNNNNNIVACRPPMSLTTASAAGLVSRPPPALPSSTMTITSGGHAALLEQLPLAPTMEEMLLQCRTGGGDGVRGGSSSSWWSGRQQAAAPISSGVTRPPPPLSLPPPPPPPPAATLAPQTHGRLWSSSSSSSFPPPKPLSSSPSPAPTRTAPPPPLSFMYQQTERPSGALLSRPWAGADEEESFSKKWSVQAGDPQRVRTQPLALGSLSMSAIAQRLENASDAVVIPAPASWGLKSSTSL